MLVSFLKNLYQRGLFLSIVRNVKIFGKKNEKKTFLVRTTL